MEARDVLDSIQAILVVLIPAFFVFLGNVLTHKASMKKINLEREQLKEQKETETEKRMSAMQKESEERLNQKIDELSKDIHTKIDAMDEKIDSVSLQMVKMENSYQNLETKVDLRMDIIEKKQDKYNNVIARQYRLEAAVNGIEDDIWVLRGKPERKESHLERSLKEGLLIDSTSLT